MHRDMELSANNNTNAFKVPNKFRVPSQLKEAMLVIETGFPPDVLGEMPEHLLDEMVLYRGVKNVIEYGGNWQP